MLILFCLLSFPFIAVALLLLLCCSAFSIVSISAFTLFISKITYILASMLYLSSSVCKIICQYFCLFCIQCFSTFYLYFLCSFNADYIYFFWKLHHLCYNIKYLLQVSLARSDVPSSLVELYLGENSKSVQVWVVIVILMICIHWGLGIRSTDTKAVSVSVQEGSLGIRTGLGIRTKGGSR